MYKYNIEYISPAYKNAINDILSHKHFIDKQLSARIIKDGYIIPSTYFFSGGVLDCNGNSVPQGSFNERYKAGSIKDVENAVMDNACVIFLGFFHNVWGHCLMDGVKKLWYLKTQECQQLLTSGTKLVYITPESVELKAYALNYLKMAGLDIDCLKFINRPIRFSKIIVPDNSLICSMSKSIDEEEYYYTKEFIATYQLIKTNIEHSCSGFFATFPKLYLTRKKIKNRLRDIGEESIESVFRKEGCMVISPEKYSLAEQFSFMGNCKELICTEGSISHNAIFCKPGTKLILVRKSYYINGYQVAINELAGLDVTYIDAHNSTPFYQFSRVSGPFFMCVTPELERFIGHKIFHLPLWLRPSWWWYCNRNRKIVHLFAKLFGCDKW